MHATATTSSEFPAAAGTLRGGVRVWATALPAEAALFFREGWDWRWWTWADLERNAEIAGSGGELPVAVPPEVRAFCGVVGGDRPGAGQELFEGEPPPTASGLPPPPTVGRFRRALRVAFREVVVEAGPNADPLRLAWLRWSVAERAAIVLAPTLAAWTEVVLFARPTVLWGGVDRADALLDRVSGKRRRIDRLRAFGWLERSEVPASTVRRFAELGVAVVRLRPAGGAPLAATPRA